MATLDNLLGKINAGEGSLGMLLNDRALYDSLTVASGNLASLLANLEQYPGRYVHFSLFGRSPEKMKTKADRRAAREAEKQLKDSSDAPGRRAFRFSAAPLPVFTGAAGR